MNITVCIKQVIDPEAPPASFEIDPSSNNVLPGQNQHKSKKGGESIRFGRKTSKAVFNL